MDNTSNKSIVYYIPHAIIFLIVFRLILTAAIPLLDKTEARYAEISRLMYETGEWVVLQIDYGVPFWAKPPFSTWLSSLSFNFFGVSEISARLPSFLLALLILIPIAKWNKKQNTSDYLPAFILLTTPEFLIHTGVVSTDSSLAFAVVLTMFSFWKVMSTKKTKLWGYLFFIGLGIGILSKGPIIFILTVPPIIAWACFKFERLKIMLRRIPWMSGITFFLIISIPWFFLVEKRSPGFINYFIVGEHFKRFFESGWSGDLYGRPKSEPLGKIWLYLMIFAFPWIQIVLYSLWKNRKRILDDSWALFLAVWLLWTPLFFTFSSNILHTYILPVMVPMALIITHWWGEYSKKNMILKLGLIFPGLTVIAFIGISISDDIDYYMNSDKYLLKDYREEIVNETLPLYYWKNKSYSGQFYSAGKAKSIGNTIELDSIFNTNEKFLLVISKRDKGIILNLNQNYELVDENYKTKIYIKSSE